MRAPLSTILLLLSLLPALAAGAAAAQQPAPAPAPPQQAPAAPQSAQQQHRTGASGLPLPRFASLASSEVNVRTGPGKDYPIHWVYTRLGLPVRILDEYDVWRLVEDPDGDKGWTHSSLLSLHRTMMVKGGVQAMRRSADGNSGVVLRAEPGVVGELLNCDHAWCRVEIEGRRGWLPRDAIWGVLPNEWQN
jgi:SH3-like domain-containing protein